MGEPSREVLVILPTFNERETLSGVIAGVLGSVPEARVLVVDDGSPDGTGALADRLAASEPRVEVLHRAGKSGLGTAYIAGFRAGIAAGYRLVVEMDADGSHLAGELPLLLDAARANGGAAIGARWIEGGRIVGWPRYRRWISRTGTRVARIALRSGLHDLTSGFRAIDASCWRASTWTRSILRDTASRWRPPGSSSGWAAPSRRCRSRSWSARAATRR
nr:glycosyltransferase [Leucobacter muris]